MLSSHELDKLDEDLLQRSLAKNAELTATVEELNAALQQLDAANSELRAENSILSEGHGRMHEEFQQMRAREAQAAHMHQLAQRQTVLLRSSAILVGLASTAMYAVLLTLAVLSTQTCELWPFAVGVAAGLALVIISLPMSQTAMLACCRPSRTSMANDVQSRDVEIALPCVAPPLPMPQVAAGRKAPTWATGADTDSTHGHQTPPAQNGRNKVSA